MDKEGKPLGTFTVVLGFYECNRMPFGLTSAPATFQQLMETCFGDLNLKLYIIYLDDIVIFFFKRSGRPSREAGGHVPETGTCCMKLKPSKCELFHRQITYLGHIVSAQRIATDEGKIMLLECGLPPPPLLMSEVSWGLQVITTSSSTSSCR